MHMASDSGSVASTMQILIEVMAERSEGVAANLSDDEFIEMLQMVCDRKKVDCREAEDHLKMIGKRQGGVLTYENLKSHDCPKID